MSNNKQQTALEWYANQLNRVVSNTTDASTHNSKELLAQAKEMEREQIINAFVECWKANMPDGCECKLSADEYYKETFKKEIMEAKEKAKELIRKYNIATWIKLDEIKFLTKIPTAHECALIAVDEILNDDWYIATREDLIARKEYWQEVKQEIRKL